MSGNEPVGWPMTDGDVTTRWETPSPQTVGDQVTVTLGQPADLARVELEVGRWFHDFPRRLRIDVAPAVGEPAVTVWEGGGAGPTVLGALEDPARVPIRFDLPEGTHGQQIVLTLTAEHLTFAWSIAELRVLGRQ